MTAAFLDSAEIKRAEVIAMSLLRLAQPQRHARMNTKTQRRATHLSDPGWRCKGPILQAKHSRDGAPQMRRRSIAEREMAQTAADSKSL
jgi:hypothetical protein